MRFIVLIMLLGIFCNYSQGSEKLMYNETISQKIFVDWESNRIGLPGARKYSFCFFIKGSELDLQRLNKLLSFSLPDEDVIDVYVFFQEGIRPSHMSFVENWDFNFISVEKNRVENKEFFSKVCGTCFSMLVLEGNRVKFFHSGFGLHYFSEVIQNLK